MAAVPQLPVPPLDTFCTSHSSGVLALCSFQDVGTFLPVVVVPLLL